VEETVVVAAEAIARVAAVARVAAEAIARVAAEAVARVAAAENSTEVVLEILIHLLLVMF
jgi:hypothetical protein